jgi:two-component system sensor histidine kinase QseC
MYSIRGRLTLMLVLSLGLLLLGSGGLLYTVIRAQLVGEFDRVLLAKSQALISLTEDIGTAIELDFADAFMPEFEATENPEYFALWRASGELIHRSPSLVEPELRPQAALTNTPIFRNVILPNGLAGRLIEMAFVPRREMADTENDDANAEETTKPDWMTLDPTHVPERAAILLVARDRVGLDTLLRTLWWVLGLVILGLLAIMVVLVHLALRLGLRPLDDVRQQVEHVDAESLATGLQVNTQTRELAPVVMQLNALLRRLDAAFARERQFSSDVAHELRTPLAELRTLTDVGQRWPEDVDAVTQYFADAQAIALHMERIVVSLLTLTRCENGLQQVSTRPINVRQIIDAGWATVDRLAQEKGLSFECTIPPTYCVTSDYDMLLTVLSNFLSNAVMYSPSQSAIHCSATVNGHAMRLTIRNSTKELTSADLPHIFERFWRKDPARSAEDHSGLGLAIVKALSDLLHLEVHATIEADHSFAVSISLPCTADVSS